MIDSENYIAQLTEKLKKVFRDRLLYVGLQGSYLRGEATANSDIDIMIVIDGLCVQDLDSYRAIIESLDNSEKSCGFICSKEDLLCWNPLEICHLINSTKDCYGILELLVPVYTEQDIRNFIKLTLNNLYHEICHRYIHANMVKNTNSLPAAYKNVFFILQNLHYLQNRKFICTKAELLQLINGKNRDVLLRSIELSAGKNFDFNDSFTLLFSWCQETLKSLS